MILINETQTREFASSIAKTLKVGDIILLSGDLGSGKTFIAREIIQNLAKTAIKVTSPTFNILQTYETASFIVYHYDLYRLKFSHELHELGIEEALNGSHICIIEWPEILLPLLPKPYIQIHLEVIGTTRKCTKMIFSS